VTFGLRVLAFLVMLWLVSTPLSQADQPVSIRTLLNSASSFQAHAVTVVGIAKDRQDIPPFSGGKCGIVYDSYMFTLEDESGSIRIEVFGVCRMSGVRAPVSDGQKALVQGFFIVHSSDGIDASLIYTNTFAVKQIPN